MLKPEARVVMVSGANRGIGQAIAKTLASTGYCLSLGARDPDAIDTAAFATELMTYRWDARQEQTAKSWVQATRERFNRIDALVLNAGVMVHAGIEHGDDEALDLMWEVNFKGPLRLVRAAWPALKASGSGRVVNIVSLAGKRLLSEQSLGYGASKHAAMALNGAIRRHGWSDGIRATAICPGLVDTDMVAGIEPSADEYKIAPEAIAATVAYALSLPNAASVAEVLVNSRFEAMF